MAQSSLAAISAPVSHGKDTSGEEIWRDVPGYEGFYQASTHGRIRSVSRLRLGRSNSKIPVRGRILKTRIGTTGYPGVRLSKFGIIDDFNVHRLVAITFLPNPNNLPCVNHIDYDRTNPDVSNLEWVSYTQNVHHSLHAGRMPNIGKGLLQWQKDNPDKHSALGRENQRKGIITKQLNKDNSMAAQTCAL